MKSDRQKLIDIMFEIAMASAEHMHGKSPEEIAAWVRDKLEGCGFPTKPMGCLWGVLEDEH